MLIINIREASSSGSLFRPWNVLWKKHETTPGVILKLPMKIPKPTLLRVVKMKSAAKVPTSFAPTVPEVTHYSTLFGILHVQYHIHEQQRDRIVRDTFTKNNRKESGELSLIDQCQRSYGVCRNQSDR